MSEIHPTAIIAPNVKLGKNVRIGAYAIIHEDCSIGDDCWIDSHVKIARWTTIGARCRIYHGAVVGDDPQDHRFQEGLKSTTEIGDDCIIREYVTIHRSPTEGGKTTVGNHSMLMAFVHLGHDGRVGNHVIVANNTALSGHVTVEDNAVISGYVLVHQFCRIGKLAMIGGGAVVRQDVPPFCMVGEGEYICGPNVVGLRRGGFENAQRKVIRQAIKEYFFKRLNATDALANIQRDYPDSEEAMYFVNFIKNTSRGILSGVPEMVALSNHQSE